MLDPVVDFVRRKEQQMRSFSAARADAAMAEGMARNAKLFDNEASRREAVERILRGMNVRDDDLGRGAIISHLREQMLTPEGRQQAIQAYGPMMNRGPGGYTKQGLGEAIHRTMADNKYVRRGAVATGVGMAGVGMTAGAQQLMALMSYLQGSQDTEARTEQPLTS